MKTLPTKEELNQLLTYDPVTGTLIWKEREIRVYQDKAWNKKYANREAFTAVDRKGYKVGSIYSVNVRSHRVIWKMVHGTEPDHIDHINGDPSDNRLENLRNVSNQQNHMNIKKPTNNTSGVIGVHWNKEKQAWDARIGYQGKSRHLGRFAEKDQAIAARKAAEIELNFHQNHGR